MPFMQFFAIAYTLGMCSAALALLLGSSVDDPKLASEMLPVIYVPQMLLAGFFVAAELIPVWLRWAQYICILTYAVRLMVVAEFESCEDPEAQGNCNRIIKNVDADVDAVKLYWGLLVGLFVVFRSMALYNLKTKATKFY
eukprot:CAMPEP_0118685148 /NCGR_PEP_ID=MMETSP0800-20121206/7071_1 /TAXON_ID=210618 ORGANISM="Striatella unipunctata, Strain CCMP2910" /NCGR_SAMPLE_ID=MMETSP0800 /ASSEMBLY_ACC=CAM_ASM_000638 /LENGTH=139 /DNA_ID=CAMNT_0006581999 /DNA_START=321 /DNA_END=740 /DNA_ORIENTATION=-